MKAIAISALLLLPAAWLAERNASADVGTQRAMLSAEHVPLPGESVAERSAQGNHFEALVALLQSEKEPSLADKLAGARSAWALGLIDRARSLWEEVFALNSFRDQERYRAMLARGIMELQERHFEEARSLAEQAASQIGPSEIRAQLWLLIAEALKEQHAMSVAERYYQRAIEEGSRDIKNEARFLLGECQLQLGMMNEARYSYTGVESDSTFTVQSLHRLVQIDLQQRNYEGVLTWVSEGRENFPTEFREGEMSYAQISALTELGRIPDAERELSEFKARASDENPWRTLADAAVEAGAARPPSGQPSSVRRVEEAR